MTVEERQERAYDGLPCTCTDECEKNEEQTAERCTGDFGNEPCGCEACGARSAERYADDEARG